jgi:hypothetical protein
VVPQKRSPFIGGAQEDDSGIYRRWKSKLDITVALISKVAVGAIDVPDTGTLHDDVREYLNRGREALTHRLASKIIPDLLDEGVRNPDLTSALLESVRAPRRAKAAQLIQRAVDLGELPADADIGLCLDFLGGPLYRRMTGCGPTSTTPTWTKLPPRSSR